MSIISQKPVVYPATNEKQYGEMKIKHFSIVRTKDKTILKTHLVNCDSSGETDPGEAGYSFSLHNIEEQAELYPSLKLALEKIYSAIGLLYDYYYLEEEVNKATMGGQEAPELVVARDAAYDKLLAPSTTKEI